MADDKGPTERTPSGAIELLTGRVGRITALIVAVAALLSAFMTLTQAGREVLALLRPAPSAARNAACFEPSLTYPKRVALAKWDDMDLQLTGRNNCKDGLPVYVVFKGRKVSLRIDPPFSAADCRFDDASCWEQRRLDKGDVHWRLTPPILRSLQEPLSGPTRMDINWIVYSQDTRAIMAAQTARILIVNSPAAGADPGDLAHR